MKFQVQMKDPDTLDDAIADAVHADTESISDVDERISIKDIRGDKARAVCRKWFRYGEYLTVEIDTDAGTCVVVENK